MDKCTINETILLTSTGATTFPGTAAWWEGVGMTRLLGGGGGGGGEGGGEERDSALAERSCLSPSQVNTRSK